MTASAAREGSTIGRVELVGILAMAMALGALGIDLMLPAFPDMRQEFGLDPDSNRIAGVVTTYVLGFSVGTLFFGPLSDRYGRKPALYLGFAVYAAGAIASALAPSLGTLLGARLLWGFGAASARTVAVSIVRDLYDGDRMARIMSFIIAVFILVPIVAPSLGAGIVAVAPWETVFWVSAGFAAMVGVWSLRLPETLRPDDRRTLRARDLLSAAKTVMTTRQTIGHTLAYTASFAAFLSYLASSELIVDEVLGHADRFPLIFGGLAAVLGVAMLLNGTIVERFGTVPMLRVTLVVYVTASLGFLVLSLATGGQPGLWPFLVAMALVLSMHALVIPNTNSRAMDPMGPIAGMASAVIGAISTAVGGLAGAVIDGFYDGTVTPLAVGFVVSSIAALVLVAWAERPVARSASTH